MAQTQILQSQVFLKTHTILPLTTGMGSTITTIATRANKTNNGWYRITDEGNTIELWYEGQWKINFQAGNPTFDLENTIQRSPYIIGSNDEDILYCTPEITGDGFVFLKLPDTPIIKPVKVIYCGSSGLFLQSTTHKYDINSNVIGGNIIINLQFIQDGWQYPSYAAEWYSESSSGDRSFLKTNARGCYFIINPGILSTNGSLYDITVETDLIAYIKPGRGRWGNMPYIDDNGCFKRNSASNSIGNLVNNDLSVIGAIDGVNTQYVVSHNVIPNSESIYYNGILQDPKSPHSAYTYTIYGNIFTFSFAPKLNSSLIFNYYTQDEI